MKTTRFTFAAPLAATLSLLAAVLPACDSSDTVASPGIGPDDPVPAGGCSGTADGGATCSTIAPCPTGQVCSLTSGTTSGFCVAGTTCDASNLCPQGQNCVIPSGATTGTCTGTAPVCTTTSCPANYTCEVVNVTITCNAPTCGTCPSGTYCNGTACIGGSNPCAGVVCGAGQYCSNGTCYGGSSGCTSNSQCSSGQVCQNNTCVSTGGSNVVAKANWIPTEASQDTDTWAGTKNKTTQDGIYNVTDVITTYTTDGDAVMCARLYGMGNAAQVQVGSGQFVDGLRDKLANKHAGCGGNQTCINAYVAQHQALVDLANDVLARDMSVQFFRCDVSAGQPPCQDQDSVASSQWQLACMYLPANGNVVPFSLHVGNGNQQNIAATVPEKLYTSIFGDADEKIMVEPTNYTSAAWFKNRTKTLLITP